VARGSWRGHPGEAVGRGGHYSPRNARYDWLTLNHFADIGGADGFGATLSNADCAFVRLGQSTIDRLDTSTPLLSVLVGGQVDGPKLGIPSQGGDSRFRQRFALTTRDRFDGLEAMRFALEHQNPLATGVVVGGRPHSETEFSLLTVSSDEALVWAVKPAEDASDGSAIVRLWNQAREPVRATVRFAGTPVAARRLTHIETDLGEAPLEASSLPVDLAAQQLRTFKIQFAPTSQP
jgi:alpha-mannosidase